ncbi:hypothetical protein NQ314_010965 [Rhamnusium bicolor]|uniref:DUF2382 domain-containing protein n=1 Tax=Rhamnusium bicolor TaxID=1586634 RepID=A0AAV8XLR2_9CUCU|nr:hypothetical protein NQ314_010965 [Rhamnusium bicolor]
MGISPSEALLGADLPMPGSWQHPEERVAINNTPLAREERIHRAQSHQVSIQRELFSRSRDAPVQLVVGQQVLVRTHELERREFGRT